MMHCPCYVGGGPRVEGGYGTEERADQRLLLATEAERSCRELVPVALGLPLRLQRVNSEFHSEVMDTQEAHESTGTD